MAITCRHFRFYSHVTRLNLRIFWDFANEIPWNSPFLPVKSQFRLVQWPWNRPRKAIPSLYLQCCSLTRREAAVSSRNWGWVPALRPCDPTRDSSQESGNFSVFSPQNSWKPELNRLRIFLKSGLKIVKINFNRDWLWLWLWIWSSNEAINIVIKTGRKWSIANILTG